MAQTAIRQKEGRKKRENMTALAIVTVALVMSWVVPDLESVLRRVNINKATLDELLELDGIGHTVAERILAFREKNGPFQKPEDLMMVKGVGHRLFDINSDRIVVKGR
ncbi:MAG: ComEA family DNA-binding protein [Gammaproteobacteria bacterium]